MKTRREFFSVDEITLMVQLTAEANPDRYVDPEVKALIWRCRGLVERGHALIAIRSS